LGAETDSIADSPPPPVGDSRNVVVSDAPKQLEATSSGNVRTVAHNAAERANTPAEDIDWVRGLYLSYGTEEVSPPRTPSASSAVDEPWGGDSPSSPLVAGTAYPWHPFLVTDDGRPITPGTAEHRERIQRWSVDRTPRSECRQRRSDSHSRQERETFRSQRRDQRGRPALEWGDDGRPYYRPLNISDVRLPTPPPGMKVPKYMRGGPGRNRVGEPSRRHCFPPFDAVFVRRPRRIRARRRYSAAGFGRRVTRSRKLRRTGESRPSRRSLSTTNVQRETTPPDADVADGDLTDDEPNIVIQ
jgi:hypothetical protein